MYNTTEEYVKACELTGLKHNDIVKLIRKPNPEDGKSPMFRAGLDNWCTFYRGLEECIGHTYKIAVIDFQGLITLNPYTPQAPYNSWRLPFFLFEGYDHLANLRFFSKSNFLAFDKIAQEKCYV